MPEKLKGKVVLVTGGARRVGAAICRRLHGCGAELFVHYRSAAQELVKAAVKEFGRLDVVINNASSFYPTAIGEITEKEWDDLVGTNLKAPLFLSQAAAPELKKNHG